MRLYLAKTVIDRGIFTVEDEYKFVCALSNNVAFDDLELPRTLVSRSRYSLKVNISQTVHDPLHPIWVIGVDFCHTRIAVARNPCVS